MSRYIDDHRGRFGVEPICRVLDVSASAYYRRATGARSERQVEDERLLAVVDKIHEANYFAYGYRKMWKALRRAGEDVGRDHVKRLMRQHGIRGTKRRGKPWRTTIADPAAASSPDLVQRNFTAERPDALWVADFSYVRCWEGMVFFSFVIDVFSRRIVGWQFASNMRTDLVLDALLGTRSFRLRPAKRLSVEMAVAGEDACGAPTHEVARAGPEVVRGDRRRCVWVLAYRSRVEVVKGFAEVPEMHGAKRIAVDGGRGASSGAANVAVGAHCRMTIGVPCSSPSVNSAASPTR